MTQAETGLTGKQMHFVVGVFVRRSGGTRHSRVVAMHVGAHRVGPNAGGDHASRHVETKMRPMADIDANAALQRARDHRMDFTRCIDKTAGMAGKRMGQDIALFHQRDDVAHRGIDIHLLATVIFLRP